MPSTVSFSAVNLARLRDALFRNEDAVQRWLDVEAALAKVRGATGHPSFRCGRKSPQGIRQENIQRNLNFRRACLLPRP